jgi:hypothetical protein
MQRLLFGNAALKSWKFRDGMLSDWLCESAKGERLVS